MRVVFVPFRLRLVSGLLLLAVPLAALETMVVTHAHWWRLPYKTLEIWCGGLALVCLPLVYGLMKGRKWAISATAVLFSIWFLLSAWVAFRTRNTSLAFFSIALLGLFGGYYCWLRFELGRSFLDPRMDWFQGLPRALPGVSCAIGPAGSEVPVRVTRLDRDGAFVFRDDGALPLPDKQGSVPLMFSFRNAQVRCQGIPVTVLGRRAGAGLLFSNMSGDARKELGDFIEQVRGEGHE